MEEIKEKQLLQEEIIYSLLYNKEYFGGVIGYLKPDYFDGGYKEIVKTIRDIYSESQEKPNPKDIILRVKDLPKSQLEPIKEALSKSLKAEIHASPEVLEEATEKFIKNSIFTEALITGADAMGSNDEKKKLESFKLAEEAFRVSLDTNFGVTFDDLDERIEYYQDDTEHLKFDIPSFDDMIGRGIYSKSLTVYLAPPGIGKTAAMVANACEFAKMGFDIVIASLEMPEEEYFKRIDANMLDIPIADLETISPIVIKQKYQELREQYEKEGKKLGKIIVKEFPSYGLTALQLTGFLDKLEQKMGITQPIVFVDYLQLMSSDRLHPSVGSYEYVKSITSELRAVAQKRDLKIFTASQLNRSAVNNLDAGQEAVSDSAGISMFADAMIFLLQTKDMKMHGEIKVQFEKNRYGGKTFGFKIGFDYQKMRFVDKYYGTDNADDFSTDISSELSGIQDHFARL